MKSRNELTRLAALGLLLLIYAQGARVVRAEDAARVRLLRGRLAVVPVHVNGEGPFDFLLDTGTTSTLVTPELAARLGLRAADRVTLVTVAGERAVARARIGRLEVGGRTATDVEALLCGLEQVRALDARLSGVLGQNFLERFNYTLDYGARLLRFEDEGGAPPRGERVPVERAEGKLLVAAVPAGDAPRALRLVLDAAATGLILFDERPGGLAPDSFARDVRLALTEAGVVGSRGARLRALRVGGSRLADIPVALLPDPAGRASRAEDGLLPTSLFRAVYFNNAEGFVIFDPRPAR
jgi:predicted aspartyl protease